MIEMYQITLTKEERVLLNRLINVATTFIMALHDDMGTEQDAKNVQWVLERPMETEALVKKINKDRF